MQSKSMMGILLSKFQSVIQKNNLNGTITSRQQQQQQGIISTRVNLKIVHHYQIKRWHITKELYTTINFYSYETEVLIAGYTFVALVLQYMLIT